MFKDPDLLRELLWRWLAVSPAQCNVCDGGYQISLAKNFVYFFSDKDISSGEFTSDFPLRLEFCLRQWIEGLRWNWSIKKTRKGYRCVLRRGHLRRMNTIHAFNSDSPTIALLSAYVQLLELLREDNYVVS